MSAKRAFIAIIALALLSILMFSHAIGNSLMLMMDRENFLPAEASIFTLNPYVINEGSSSYWIYAEDGSNYYFFTYEPGREYLVMSKNQSCPDFKKEDVMTWCNARPRSILGGKE